MSFKNKQFTDILLKELESLIEDPPTEAERFYIDMARLCYDYGLRPDHNGKLKTKHIIDFVHDQFDGFILDLSGYDI